MKTIDMGMRALPWLAAAVIGASALPAHAVDCAAPKSFDETRGCAAAKQGAEALRRYVERTRMIHGLYYWDYAPYATSAAVATRHDERTLVARAK
jgi:hypothetical protein